MDRRAALDRRERTGRRVEGRRVADLPVAAERRFLFDRRSGLSRRSFERRWAERRVPAADRRTGERRVFERRGRV